MDGSIRSGSEDSPTPIAEAVSILGDRLGPIERTETVSIGTNAVGRVLAEPVVATRDLPHFRRSERDGYAIRSDDTVGATEDAPVELTATNDTLGPGETKYVHTGSAVPGGADAVVMIEDVTETATRIEIYKSVESGTHVTPIGADLRAGTELYTDGHRLRPGDLGTLRVAGVREVSVLDFPTVAVIPTGEELVQTDPGPGEVVETNGLVGAALVEHWCGTARYRDVVTDDEDALLTALERDLDADLILTTGGSSVGSRDLLPTVVEERGEILVRGLALRPGHSGSIGTVAGTPIAMLPGTPVATLVLAWLLVRPALAGAVGASVVPPPTVRARLEGDIESETGRRTVHGVTVANAPDQSDIPLVRRAERGGLPSLARIDGWVQVNEPRDKLPAGEVVTVEKWGTGPC